MPQRRLVKAGLGNRSLGYSDPLAADKYLADTNNCACKRNSVYKSYFNAILGLDSKVLSGLANCLTAVKESNG